MMKAFFLLNYFIYSFLSLSLSYGNENYTAYLSKNGPFKKRTLKMSQQSDEAVEDHRNEVKTKEVKAPHNKKQKINQEAPSYPSITLEDLPSEVKNHILSFLDIRSTTKLSMINSNWKYLAESHVKIRTGESSPLFHDSSLPWQTTYWFRTTLCRFFGAYHTTIGTDQFIPFALENRFVQFCEHQNLPHKHLLKALFLNAQNHIIECPMAIIQNVNLFWGAHLEKCFLNDPFALELSLILDIFNINIPSTSLYKAPLLRTSSTASPHIPMSKIPLLSYPLMLQKRTFLLLWLHEQKLINEEDLYQLLGTILLKIEPGITMFSDWAIKELQGANHLLQTFFEKYPHYASTKTAPYPYPKLLHLRGICHQYGYSGIKRNTQQAFEDIKGAAKAGLRQAQYELGSTYQHALLNVKADLIKAEKWYEVVANAEDTKDLILSALAQYCLGTLYRKDLFDDKAFTTDYEKAFGWFYKSAQPRIVPTNSNIKHSCAGTYMLAHCYEVGAGTNKNLSLAKKLYEKIFPCKNHQEIMTLSKTVPSSILNTDSRV